MLSQVLAVASVHAVPGPRLLPTGRPGATTTWLPPRRAGARGLTIGIVSVPRGVRQSPCRRSLSRAQLPTLQTLSCPLENGPPAARGGPTMPRTHFVPSIVGVFDGLSGQPGIPVSASDGSCRRSSQCQSGSTSEPGMVLAGNHIRRFSENIQDWFGKPVLPPSG